MGGPGLTFLALYPVLIVPLVLVSSTLGRGGDERVTGSDGTVRDVSLVIKYQTAVYGRNIPKPESASCMTSDPHHDLNSSVVPNDAAVVSSPDTAERLNIHPHKDEDLRLPLLTPCYEKLLWQKEPWMDSA
ncbi:hypothetical protein GWK47_020068 [Chionoecetes opilio]|uniref:Uncharacterized protein n=1 Tax=Chionoecetes opilio TaxID=41210 RepID=A0A8J4XQ02_CHIOP|nr:hypothetical protein GWK47_020068 [Chionoecetes opilio]